MLHHRIGDIVTTCYWIRVTRVVCASLVATRNGETTLLEGHASLDCVLLWVIHLECLNVVIL